MNFCVYSWGIENGLYKNFTTTLSGCFLSSCNIILVAKFNKFHWNKLSNHRSYLILVSAEVHLRNIKVVSNLLIIQLKSISTLADSLYLTHHFFSFRNENRICQWSGMVLHNFFHKLDINNIKTLKLKLLYSH